MFAFWLTRLDLPVVGQMRTFYGKKQNPAK